MRYIFLLVKEWHREGYIIINDIYSLTLYPQIENKKIKSLTFQDWKNIP
jgi:AMMECR1 domain-containing protein